jgi:hypothetical protein
MSLKSIITYIGKNNKPYYPTVAVASAELIFRPTFTMMDKKSPEETKKYTALREGITELIAAPTYLVVPILAGKASSLLKMPTKEGAKMAKHNLQTLGTWVAALIVIPALCSAIVKPFMNKIYSKRAKKNTQQQLDVKLDNEELKIQKPPISQTGHLHTYPIHNVSITSFANSGMRVG